MKYTEGQWIRDGGTINGEDGYPIAIVFPDTRLPSDASCAKRLANARLIEEAPNLHRELQTLWDMGAFEGVETEQYERIKQTLVNVAKGGY